MAMAGQRVISQQEEELLSFLKQNIICKLIEFSSQWGLSPMNPQVTQAVSRYFNVGPVPHQVSDNLVWQLAHFVGE